MSTRGGPPEPHDSDLPAFDLKQLRHFLAIVEQGHFGRAAQQLGISKQGISQSVAALEETLGVRLFERGQFGAVPTEFGRALTQYAKVIQAETRKARAEIDGLRERKSPCAPVVDTEINVLLITGCSISRKKTSLVRLSSTLTMFDAEDSNAT